MAKRTQDDILTLNKNPVLWLTFTLPISDLAQI
jgi:hypothetical protein